MRPATEVRAGAEKRGATVAPSIARDHPLAVYYEHPDWFRPLFAELDRRGVPYVRLHADTHTFDPTEAAAPYSLVCNRMSPSAYTRGRGDAIFYTVQFLAHLKRLGVRVVNGYDAFLVEISKAGQLSLLRSLGVPHPRARVIHDPRHAVAASERLRFPVVVKPNVGGSGAGVRRFESPSALRRAAEAGELALGLDHTALVQEFIPAQSDRIVRVEVLGGRYLYAIRIYTPGDTFNLCPADVCHTVDGAELARIACPVDAPKNALRVEGYAPSAEIVRQVEQIVAAAQIDVGGVEYVVGARDGRLYFYDINFYDINALSNFVADAPRVVGFDPFARLVDYLIEEAR